MTAPWKPLAALAASTLIVGLLAAGCGDDSAEHLRRLGEYTPANLADELVSRFQNLNQVQEKTSEAGRGEELTKGAGLTKGARSGSAFDQLIQDIAGKAARVPNAEPAEVFRQVAERVDARKSIADKDRDRIKTALKSAMKLGT